MLRFDLLCTAGKTLSKKIAKKVTCTLQSLQRGYLLYGFHFRYDRMRREDKRPDKHSDSKYKEGPPPVQKKPSAKPDIIRRDVGPSKATRGDEWHDPWQRYFVS